MSEDTSPTLEAAFIASKKKANEWAEREILMHILRGYSVRQIVVSEEPPVLTWKGPLVTVSVTVRVGTMGAPENASKP